MSDTTSCQVPEPRQPAHVTSPQERTSMVKQKNGAIVRRIVGYRRFEELDLNQYGRVTGRV